VGLSPLVPHIAAGSRIEPPVSEPIAIVTTPAATAAAEPPDDPPGIRVVSKGLSTGPKQLTWEVAPQASSCWLVLAIKIAPAARSLAATAESWVAISRSR